MRYLKIGLILMVLSIFAAGVFASEPNGAAVTPISTETWDSTGVAGGTQDAQGGNLTVMNTVVTVQTTFWQLFYGNVSSQVVLRNNAGTQDAYSWAGTTDVANGNIFFANDAGFNFAGTANGTAADLTNENTELGMGSSNDNITNTIATSTDSDIELGAIDLSDNGIPALKSLNNTDSAAWTTAIVNDGAGNVAYVGWINEASVGNSFDNEDVDYQVMVPANQTARTYSVFVSIV